MARKEYAGAAPRTTLTSTMTAGSPTSGGSFTVQSGTGYPTGAYPGGFVVVTGNSTQVVNTSVTGAYNLDRSDHPRPTGNRVLVDFVKPYPAVFLGLGTLQWAAVVTIAYYAPDLWRWFGLRQG